MGKVVDKPNLENFDLIAALRDERGLNAALAELVRIFGEDDAAQAPTPPLAEVVCA